MAEPGWSGRYLQQELVVGIIRDWVLQEHHLGAGATGHGLSNRQIALELGLETSDTQAMTEPLRHGLVAKTPAVELTGEVEPDARASSGIDEVYVAAGHKGQPAALAERGGPDGAAGWQAHRATARWRRTSRPSSAWSSAADRSCCACWPVCSRPRSSRSSPPPSPRIPLSTRMSTASTPACPPARLGLRAQNGLPCPRRIRLRRGRRRLLRGPRQHHGGVLVAAALLVAPAL